jgi:hypothetical protein
MRQMCAKVHPALIDRLDQVLNLLDMSKREFIEAAVSDALAHAEARSSVRCPGSREPVMLTLTGTIRAVTTWAVASTRRPARSSHSTCAPDRGPRQPWPVPVFTLTVPDTKPFEGRVDEQVSVPCVPGLLARP